MKISLTFHVLCVFHCRNQTHISSQFSYPRTASLQDVPKDCPCSAFCLHVHPWQCRTNRICNVPSCMCNRLRSMRSYHGRNLFCAMLLCLSTSLRRRIAGSNSLRKKTNMMCLHAKCFGQFKLEHGMVFSRDVGFEWGLRVIWLDWWHRSRR